MSLLLILVMVLATATATPASAMEVEPVMDIAEVTEEYREPAASEGYEGDEPEDEEPPEDDEEPEETELPEEEKIEATPANTEITVSTPAIQNQPVSSRYNK